MTQVSKDDDPESEIPQADLEEVQEAAFKQYKRTMLMGGLMRSKGFVWMATSQFFMGAWQQAGNVLRIKPARPWLCEIWRMWEDSPSAPEIRKQMKDENGEEYPYGDRCQEIVFIGKDLNHRLIQNCLDKCLLTDEEMDMGERAWQKEWYDSCDKIRLPTKLYMDDNVIRDVIKVDAMDEFEEMKDMKITEVYEDEEFGQVARVEMGQVTVTEVTPQVATEFVYEPENP